MHWGRFATALMLATLLAMLAAPATAEIFRGVDFPQGASSFADEVAAFTRGTSGTSGVPERALGPPDGPGGALTNHSVTLGNGGTLTIRFTDNILTGSGDASADLFIFETGTAQEFVTVELSEDGASFSSCGQTFGQTGEIDIDSCGFGPRARVMFVRITDVASHRPANDDTAGADIDAIGAITTISSEPNDPPRVGDDEYDTNEGGSLDVDAPGVLKNDEDPEGDKLQADLDERPNHGRVDLNQNGAFHYEPDPGFTGEDRFTYVAVDKDGATSKGRVEIRVRHKADRDGGRIDGPGLAVAGDGGVSTSDADGGVVVVGDVNAASEGNVVEIAAEPAPGEARPELDPALTTEAVIASGGAVISAPADDADDDGDGLTNGAELSTYGTDPFVWDSDADGIGDGDEALVLGTSPLVPDANQEPQPAPSETASGPVTSAPVSEPQAPEVAAPVLNCAAYGDWLTAQSAYEAAGRTAADPALVAAFDPDYDGIACEEIMQP